MRNLKWALLAGVLFTAAILLIHRSVPLSAEVERPNIVVILTDDQDIDSLPVMRKLMAYPEGSWVSFSNAFINDSICCSSRATILTGQYDSNNGVMKNNQGNKLDDENTLPVWLDEAGYETALIGKYLNGFPWNFGRDYVPPGWDVFMGPRDVEEESVDAFTGLALDFLENTSSPFFLYLSYMAPHYPADPPARYANADVYVPPPHPNVNEADVSDKPNWVRSMPLLNTTTIALWQKEQVKSQRELLAIDDGVQQIVDMLKANGQLDNTLIIFLGDNGMSWGSHRKIGKWCPYEECSRVPFLVRYPGQVGNRVEEGFVSNVDIAPTLAAFAGVQPTIPQDGRSFLPLLAEPGAPWKDEVLLERHVGSKYYGIRVPGWTYVEYVKGERELYDLNADPYQLQNLAYTPGYESKVAELSVRLAELRGIYVIAGRITSPAGQGLSGVLIADSRGHETRTAADGSFQFTGVSPGALTLTATRASMTINPVSISLTVPPSVTDLSFTGVSQRVFSVTGRLTLGGKAVAGAVISDGLGHLATTGADGRYALIGLPEGTYILTPQKAGLVFVPPTRTVALTTNRKGQDFVAGLAYSIAGRVSDPSGQPIAGVTISDGAGRTATTNALGDYQFSGLPGGVYNLSANLAGYTFSSLSPVTVPPAATGKDFTGSLLTYALSGIVEDANRDPMPGVTIRYGAGLTTTTGLSGTYTIPNLPPATYTVTAALPGYSFAPDPAVVTIIDGNKAQDFAGTLLTYELSGGVSDANGSSLSGVTITYGEGLTTTTGTDGTYAILALPPGTHTVTATLDGYSFAPDPAVVTITDDHATQNFTGTPLTYSISGTVVDENNEPLENVVINDGSGHTTQTNAFGEYTLTGLPAGDYSLSAALPGYTFTSPGSVSVPPSAAGVDFTGSAVTAEP